VVERGKVLVELLGAERARAAALVEEALGDFWAATSRIAWSTPEATCSIASGLTMKGAFIGLYKLYEVSLVKAGLAKTLCIAVASVGAAGAALGFAMVPVCLLRLPAADERGVTRAAREGVAWSGVRLWAFIASGPLAAHLADHLSYGHVLATADLGCISLAAASLYRNVRSAVCQGTFSDEQPALAALAVTGTLCLVISTVIMVVVHPTCAFLSGLHLLGVSHAVSA